MGDECSSEATDRTGPSPRDGDVVQSGNSYAIIDNSEYNTFDAENTFNKYDSYNTYDAKAYNTRDAEDKYDTYDTDLEGETSEQSDTDAASYTHNTQNTNTSSTCNSSRIHGSGLSNGVDKQSDKQAEKQPDKQVEKQADKQEKQEEEEKYFDHEREKEKAKEKEKERERDHRADSQSEITFLKLKLKLLSKESNQEYSDLMLRFEASEETVKTLVKINRSTKDEQEKNAGVWGSSPGSGGGYREGAPQSPMMISPQLSELTNSLANLKWGFRKRESELMSQIEQYKAMTLQLHASQKRLRSSLRYVRVGDVPSMSRIYLP